MAKDRPAASANGHAGVRVPPPAVFLVCLVAGLAVDSAWFNGRLAGLEASLAGGVFAALGFGTMIAGIRAQRRVGTAIEPWTPTTALALGGIYRFTRNPMYLGMIACYVGLAIAAASLAAFVALVPAVLFIRYHVIAREERYLVTRFGDTYTDYLYRVRRWL